jgi:multiple sugar transport system permease protein
MITPLCIGLFWSYILDPLTGVMNWILSSLHLPALQWLSSTETALPTLIAIYRWEWTPFTTILLMAGLLSISPSIYEAAKLEGAGWLKMALNIDIPLLGSVISVAAILAVVEVIRFDIIYGTTQGGPGSATLTNAVAIYRIGFQNFDTGYAAAASLVILVITIVVAQNLARRLAEENS